MTISMNKRPNSVIWFETQEKRGAYVFYIQEGNRMKERILDIVKEDMIAIKRKWLKMNFDGEEVRVPCDNITRFPQIGLNPTEDDQFTNVLNVFKHLLKLFNTTSHVYITHDFRHIYGCKSQDHKFGKRLSGPLLSFHPSENLSIVPEYFPRNSSKKEGMFILDVKHLIMQDVDSNIFKTLFCFKGKHILYKDASLVVYFLIFFLKEWKKQKYQNFSSLIVHSPPGHGIDEQLIVKDIDFKKSAKKRVFTYPQIIQKHHKFPNYIEFNNSNGYDLRRDGDGKLATIKVTNDYFMFFVWD